MIVFTNKLKNYLKSLQQRQNGCPVLLVIIIFILCNIVINKINKHIFLFVFLKKFIFLLVKNMTLNTVQILSDKTLIVFYFPTVIT